MNFLTFKIGTLRVSSSMSNYAIRHKILNASRMAGCPDVSATFLATFVSEVARKLCSSGIDDEIGFYLIGIDTVETIVFSFPEAEFMHEAVKDMQGFDFRTGYNEDGKCLIYAHKSLLGKGRVIEDRLLEEMRLCLSQLSHDELVDKLKLSNEKLATHKSSLEQTILERTEKLAEKESQLRLATDNMAGAMWVVDSDLKLVFASKQYEDIYGDEGGLVRPGTPIREIVLQEARCGVLGGSGDEEEIIDQRMASYQISHETTFEDQAADGREFRLFRRPTEEGYVITVAVDITELKESERATANATALIHESIQYASRIQRSVLPDKNFLDQALADHFVIWEPKDVIGGDIYLLRKCPAGYLLLVSDCTGHGVPGAFMTLITTGIMDQALIEIPSGDPALLLKRMNQLMKIVLGQDKASGESDDGFECGLCLIHKDQSRISYVGARFDLWCVDEGELIEIKGEKVGIGYRRTDMERCFTSHTIGIKEGARFFLASDGMIDQIGEVKRRGFGKKRLKQAILDSFEKSLEEQSKYVLKAFREFKGSEKSRDDVTLFGFSL